MISCTQCISSTNDSLGSEILRFQQKKEKNTKAVYDDSFKLILEDCINKYEKDDDECKEIRN